MEVGESYNFTELSETIAKQCVNASISCAVNVTMAEPDFYVVERSFGGLVQLVFLMLVYGTILLYASKMIADGSELLMLILNPGIIGGLVLPVMGAVPDGAMVLFSGLGANAEESLAVGMGTLAGSTVTLLTVPWMMCTFAGAVDVTPDGGNSYGKKPKLSKPLLKNLGTTGTVPTNEIPMNAKLMMATSVLYLIIQGPSFYFLSKDKCSEGGCTKEQHDAQVNDERNWALAGFILSLVSFLSYCIFQVTSSLSMEQQEKRMAAAKINAYKKKIIGVSFLRETGSNEEYKAALMQTFKKYDENGDGHIDAQELRVMFKDHQISLTKKEAHDLLTEMDAHSKSTDGKLTFDEFEKALTIWTQEHRGETQVQKAQRRASTTGVVRQASTTATGLKAPLIDDMEGAHGVEAEDDDDEDEEEEEVSPCV